MLKTLVSLICSFSTASAFIDGTLLRASFDGLHAKLEAASNSSMPMDAYMHLLSDYNHVLHFKMGSTAHDVYLIPDTRISETVLLTSNCSNCKGGDDS